MEVIDRVSREKEAYDEGDVWQESDKLHRRFWHVFECRDTREALKYYQDALSHFSQGASILDYGCYDGEQTAELLQLSPKKITGIDISEKAIGDARNRFKGNRKATFKVMDAHNMDFKDETFDLVAGKAILHHLEYEKAINEIERVLKPGGHAIFIEPLRDNPAGKLIRWLTPKARTEDELPLSRKQIEYADARFGGGRHRFHNLFSVGFGMLSSLFLKKPDNFLTNLGYSMDRKLARTFMKYWMRSVVLVWEKRA